MARGFASKLQGKLIEGGQVDYSLPLNEQLLPLNAQLGKTISLQFTGAIQCVGCGRAINKSYQQGYCFPCTQKLAACDICIVKPELCHFDKGTCREPEWGQSHCMQPHYVYLANTSDLKVGITRASNLPYRWIDQGATEALPILRVKTRYIAGLVEVAIAEHVKDKTNWRKMLMGEGAPTDLIGKRHEFIDKITDWLQELQNTLPADAVIPVVDVSPQTLNFPVLTYPEKLVSLSFDKTPLIEGTLIGIKGQYLLLDTGVVNIRNASGYELHWR